MSSKKKVDELEKKGSKVGDRGFNVKNVNGSVKDDIDKILSGNEGGTSIFANDTINQVMSSFITAGHDVHMAKKLCGFCVSVAVGIEKGEAYLRCLATPGKEQDYARSPNKMADAYLIKYPLIQEMIHRLSTVFHRKIANEAIQGYQASASEVLSGIREIIENCKAEGDNKTALKAYELLGKSAGIWESKSMDSNIILNSNIPKRGELPNVDISNMQIGNLDRD